MIEFGVNDQSGVVKFSDFIDITKPAFFFESQGIRIDPQQLQRIREERRPGSPYASLEQCQTDIRQANGMLKELGVPVLNTTSQSIEEISTHILKAVKSKID